MKDKKQYSTALLECSTGRRLVTICPLAFGEVGVKERVKNVLNYKKPAFWIIVVAVVACGVVTVCFATNPARSQEICVDGVLYVQSGDNIRELPDGSLEIGALKSVLHYTNEHPTEHLSSANLNEKYAGCPIYQSGAQRNVIYLEDFAGFYIPFVCNSGIEPLTLDDVVMLSQKGDALSWSDFEQYQGREVGSGLYIMRYEIDERFDVLVGGYPNRTPAYIDLSVNNEADDHIDIRTGDVSAFIEAHRNDALKVDELSAALNKLEYQPFTCDGLPEYKLYDTDGTVYSINFSEKWVWRGNSEQAELSDELIRLLRESGVLVAGEDTPTTVGPDAAATTLSEEQAAIRQAILEHNKSSYPLEYDVACCSFITLETLSGTPLAGSNTHKITYYGWALYNEYRVTDNRFQLPGGSGSTGNQRTYYNANYLWTQKDGVTHGHAALCGK